MNELTINNAIPMSKQEATSIKEINGEPAMSSLRISEIIGKKHFHVVEDIEETFKELEIGVSKFGLSYLSPQNKILEAYLLPGVEFSLVVSGYSTKYRFKLIEELISYRKNKVEPKLTPLELSQKTNELYEIELKAKEELLESKKKTIDLMKATLNNGATMSIQEFCKIVADVIYGAQLGRTNAYAVLRSMKLVMAKTPQPTQQAMTRKLLNYVKHDYGYMTLDLNRNNHYDCCYG